MLFIENFLWHKSLDFSYNNNLFVILNSITNILID